MQSTMGKIIWEIYSCEKFWLVRQRTPGRAYRLSGWSWGSKTASGDESLDGSRGAALHLATRVFLVGNHISVEQRDKERERAREKRRRNLRNLSEESLDRGRGRRRENFIEEYRKAERNRARDKTLIYNG